MPLLVLQSSNEKLNPIGDSKFSHTMNDTVESLTKRQKEMEEACRALNRKLVRISEEIEEKKREALFGTVKDLSKQEFLDLRRTLTVLGTALGAKEVVSGWVRLVDEDPKPTTKPKSYSIEMDCHMVANTEVNGIAYTATIRTRSEEVRRIVRAMLISNDMNYYDRETGEETGPRTMWEIDWDNHCNVRVAHPLSEEEYYAGLRTL